MAKKDKKAPAKDKKKGKEEELELSAKDKKKVAKGKESAGSKKKSKGVTVVDFSEEVEGSGGGRWLKRVEEGDYVFTVQSIEETRAKSGNKMLVVIFKGVSGRVRGQQLRDRFVLVPTSLFRLRQFLEAAGQEVPKKGVTINHKELIGTEVGITLRDGEEYEGKIRSEAGDYMSAEEVIISSDVSEGKSKGGKKKKGKKGKGGKLDDLDLDGM